VNEFKNDSDIKEGKEALYNLHVTQTAVAKSFTNFLTPFGLTPQQFNLLRIIRGAKQETVCLKDIRERLVDRSSDVPRLVKRLEVKGLIKREYDSLDKRQSNLSLDKEGSQLLKKIDEADPDFPYNLLGEVSHEDLKQWNSLTEKIKRAVEERIGH
jgi:DNA-binding MarR family transcriptional regulator